MLDQLVEARGLGHRAFFFVTGEGDELPNGVEEVSGHVIDEQGRIFYFWTGWDQETDNPQFATWEQVSAEPHWMDSAAYRRAREAVGL
jgi:hypothetical protein